MSGDSPEEPVDATPPAEGARPTDVAFSRALELLASGDLLARCEGVTVLAAIPGDEATDRLAALLEESSWYLRDRVVEALGARPRALGPLQRVLREGAWFARASACDALGRRSDLAAVPVLIEQVEDRNVSLQKSAVEALARLAALHGAGLIAQAVAGLPPDRRRRVQARVGHQSPHWAAELEAALGALPPERFAAPEAGTGSPKPEAPRGAARGAAPLKRFREWLARLPVIAEE